MTDVLVPDAGDGVFREALDVANVPTLLMLLVQLTGDVKWLEEPYCPERTRGLSDNDTGGLTPQRQAEIRDAALQAILRWQDGEPVAIPAPSHDLLIRMLGVSVGETIPDEYGPYIASQLGLATVESAVGDATLPPTGFRVVVVGAGFSGICAAVKLQAAGIPFLVVERSEGVGGVWFENTYPGAAVDTPNHLYCLSFAKNAWGSYFCGQKEIKDYLERIVATYQLAPHVRLGVEVVSARYAPAKQRWTVTTRDRDGRTQILEADALISGVGIFNPPVVPDIPGLDTFSGPRFHTARWPEGLDLKDKRVGIIGNGATAMQIVPAIVGEAQSVTVFQRSPQWVVPADKYRERVPASLQVLFREVPLYYLWYRIRLFWTHNDKVWAAVQKDPDWPHQERSLSALNDRFREMMTQYILMELGDRAEELSPKVVPTYPPWGKRMLMDNGWFRTLRRDDVELVAERVSRVSETHVHTAGGRDVELDVLVLATGFDVVRFISTMQVEGASGRSLREVWNDDDARAYLGLTVPDFPNLFMLYGPNMQPGHGGSIVAILEQQVDYVVKLLKLMFSRAVATVEVRQDVYDDYNRRVDAAHSRMVWTHPGMTTYYRNSRGRVVVNSPWRVVDFWRMTRRPDLDDYRCETREDIEMPESARPIAVARPVRPDDGKSAAPTRGPVGLSS